MRTLLILLFSLAGFSLVQAHAFLDHADPRVGSTVATPSHLKLWMTEGLEPAFTKLMVFDSQNKEVDLKDVKIDGVTMTVSLPKLQPGAYLVKWRAVATDTHQTSGTFTFSVQ